MGGESTAEPRHAEARLDEAHTPSTKLDGWLDAVPASERAGASLTPTGLLALQRAVGNRSALRVLARQPLGGAGDLTEEQALAKIEAMPLVMSTTIHPAPLATAEQKHDFLRAGQDLFGSLQGTVDWFGAIRSVKVPGNINLHESAAVKLEEVKTVMGANMPATSGGFQIRRPGFTPKTKLGRRSHHTIGLALDYDENDMVQIGSPKRNKDGDFTSHLVNFLETVTGGSTHMEIGANRRAVIMKMGASATPDQEAGASALLGKIKSETARLADLSRAFRDSLGTSKAAFLALRDEFFSKGADKKDVMSRVEPLVAPWIAKLDAAEKPFRDLATKAGIDASKPLTAATLQAKIEELRKAIKSADATPEAKAADSATVEELKTVIAALPKLGDFADLRKMLVSDSAFLFGTGALASSAPSLAQMLERGFFSPSKPSGTGFNEKGNFDEDFMMEMARHGFDLGACFGGSATDSMHFEFVTQMLL